MLRQRQQCLPRAARYPADLQTLQPPWLTAPPRAGRASARLALPAAATAPPLQPPTKQAAAAVAARAPPAAQVVPASLLALPPRMATAAATESACSGATRRHHTRQAGMAPAGARCDSDGGNGSGRSGRSSGRSSSASSCCSSSSSSASKMFDEKSPPSRTLFAEESASRPVDCLPSGVRSLGLLLLCCGSGCGCSCCGGAEITCWLCSAACAAGGDAPSEQMRSRLVPLSRAHAAAGASFILCASLP